VTTTISILRELVMAQKIVGLDLGSYSVKAVRLEQRGKAGFEVTGFAEVLVPPPSEGQDGPSSSGERTSVALAELKAKGMLDADVYVTGLPGDAAALRTLTFPFSDAKKIAEALPFALEGEIPLDLEDIVISWSLVDSDSGEKRTKKDGETAVLVAFARKEAVQNLLNLLAEHGIDPRHVEFDALSLSNLWDTLLKANHDEAPRGPSEMRTPGGTVIEFSLDQSEPAIAIVDIGHRRTSVCVLCKGRVVSAHTLLHGGADATRALAKAIGLPLDEAERGKRKEAFIEVQGSVAQFPDQHQISEVLKSASLPIVKRLRQIIQAGLSSSRVRVVKIVLTGGGSRVLNLDRHLAEQLNVKVVRSREIAHTLRPQLPLETPADDGAPEAALALGYALSGLQSAKGKARIDFRAGEFAWKGELDFVREKAAVMGMWAAAVVVLLAAGSLARGVVLGREDDALIKQRTALCEQITGQKIDSVARCLAMIQERINGTSGFAVPEHSAADTYLEIAKRMPASSELKRKVTELDVNGERVHLKGTTNSYDSIDKIVDRLTGGRCFANVDKGKARNVSADVIEWNVNIGIDCTAAPGSDDSKPGSAALPAAVPRPAFTPPVPTAVVPTTSPPPAPPPPPMPPPAQPVAEDAPLGDRVVIPNGATDEERAARNARIKQIRDDRDLQRIKQLPLPMGVPRPQGLRNLKGGAIEPLQNARGPADGQPGGN
jgi:general secretion pathway protein L